MRYAEITRLNVTDYAQSEELNSLCTNLSFIGSDKKVLLMTSCQASEGKSYLSIRTAYTLAQLGKRVVLVDTDLRRSTMNATYGIYLPPQANGLAHYLAGMCLQSDIVYATNVPQLSIVPVGRVVTNSLALLSSSMLRNLLSSLAGEYDIVLVDAPPVGVIIDAAEIAKSCDGALIAVSFNRVTRKELRATREQIELSGCPVLGAVLNGVDLEAIGNKKYYGYKSYYSSYYSQEKARPMHIQGAPGSDSQ